MKVLGVLLLAILIGISALLLSNSQFSAPTPPAESVSDSRKEGGTMQLQGESGEEVNAMDSRLITRKPTGPYIVIDRYSNRLYLRTADSVWLEALCSTGSDNELVDQTTGRHWKFSTPAGIFVVESKLKNPWWRKPDWAFVEEGMPLPKNDADRFDDQMMGDFAIGFGDGYFVHGTIYERLLGISVTHGCVRMGAPDLRYLYEHTPIGTRIYVF